MRSTSDHTHTSTTCTRASKNTSVLPVTRGAQFTRLLIDRPAFKHFTKGIGQKGTFIATRRSNIKR
jgi:hypothetical protein